MLRVISPGLWTSIQDKGRFGFRHLGVPVSGVMDSNSANLANLLLNNSPTDAVLEVSLSGPKLEFLVDTRIAISGADMSAKLSGVAIQLNKVINIKAGDILSFGRLQFGSRTYLAIRKGFQSELEMGSRSFYSAVSDESRLEKGDLVEYSSLDSDNLLNHAAVKVELQYFTQQTLEVFQGPEFEHLPDSLRVLLLSQKFTISKNNNRMAYQLQENFSNELKPILTSAVMPGTVQLTPSGKLIILMRDCQTTGGYPRVLQLSEESVCCLSQKKQDDRIQFVMH